MIPCVVFTAVSLLAEGFMKRLGHKTVGAVHMQGLGLRACACVFTYTIHTAKPTTKQQHPIIQSIAAGLLLMCLGFLTLGPAPFLLGLPWTRALAWVDQVLGFVLFGVGFAFVVVRGLGGGEGLT